MSEPKEKDDSCATGCALGEGGIRRKGREPTEGSTGQTLEGCLLSEAQEVRLRAEKGEPRVR